MLALFLFSAMVTAVLLLAARGVAVALEDGGSTNRALAAFRRKEDGKLVAAGFMPEEGGHFWSRAGVWFAREAALQHALQERREDKGLKTP